MPVNFDFVGRTVSRHPADAGYDDLRPLPNAGKPLRVITSTLVSGTVLFAFRVRDDDPLSETRVRQCTAQSRRVLYRKIDGLVVNGPITAETRPSPVEWKSRCYCIIA